MGIPPIPTYIAPFMRFFLRLIALTGAAVVLWYGCDGAGVEPSDELPVLSNPQTSYDDRASRFYPAVTVTIPEDGIYACKFDSPLPEGTGGSVRFAFYAFIAGDTSSAGDTLQLANLRPVILSVVGSDTLALPPVGFITLDTLRATAADPDGLDDIKRVSFTILKPDSSLGNQGQPISLADNGELDLWGDRVAGDGVYSIIIMLESDNDPGPYVYRFTAEDYSGAVSDTVFHPVVLQ